MPELLGPLARQVRRTEWLPQSFRDTVGGICATHLALPAYVRQFSTRVGGADITIGTKPRVSLVGLAYYRGLDDFEPNTIAVFAALARQARVVVDVGANVGIFSLLAARVNPLSRILAFEPHPVVAMSLARNVALSEATNVEVFPTALGASSGYIPLFTTVSDVLTSLDESRVPDAVKLIVPVTTLDAIVDERDVNGIELVKVDAEGWELPVFVGAAATFQRDRPVVIFEALADSPATAITSLFEKLDYDIWVIAKRRFERVELSSAVGCAPERNFIAIPRERLTQVLEASIEWPI